jgi:hypothetical protein
MRFSGDQRRGEQYRDHALFNVPRAGSTLLEQHPSRLL